MRRVKGELRERKERLLNLKIPLPPSSLFPLLAFFLHSIIPLKNFFCSSEMKVYAFKYSSGFICLLALFIIFEIVNYSEGAPTETLFPTLREKRARPPLSKNENKRVVKKQGTGIVGTLKGAKKSLDDKHISGTQAIGVALAGVAAGTLGGILAGRGIEKNQQGFMQGGGFVPNYPQPAIMPQQFMPQPMITCC